MAKRKSSRKGFGSSPAMHRANAMSMSKQARAYASMLRKKLVKGDCNGAMHNLLDLAYAVGSARAEGRAIGGKKAGARTYSMQNVYGSLVRKTLARCAKR